MRTKSLILLLTTFLLATSCNQTGQNRSGETTVSDKSASISEKTDILRYEVALFSLKPQSFARDLEKIAPDFRVFLGNNYNTPEAIAQLQAFVNDPQNRRTYQDCMHQYPELEWLSAGLNEALNNYTAGFPGATIPQVYTYVSGFDFQYPVKYADSTLIIALDMYLGSDYQDYRTMGIPLYVSQRLTRNHILPDCMKELAYPHLEKPRTQTLLDAMIEEGRVLYFAEALLPETAKEFIIGYSPAQLKWCYENESNLWSFLIENELLYSTDAQAMSMFMTDGPFTSSFSQESPARTGAWLGWEIVRNYAKKNGKSLPEILKNANAQEILEKSGYKPRRN